MYFMLQINRFGFYFHLITQELRTGQKCVVFLVICIQTHLIGSEVLIKFIPISCPGSRSGSVPSSGLRAGSRGEAQDGTHTLLLEALQRSGPPPAVSQHSLRLQSQPGHLPAGTPSAQTRHTFQDVLCTASTKLLSTFYI